MHTLFVDLESLAPEELDRWLARGWYRMAQSLFTCRYVVFDDVLRSAIWVRVPLSTYAFRKSLRRTLTRVDRTFRTEVGPLVVDAEREALYARYRAGARGDRSPNLRDFLYGDSHRDVFETREVRVWDGDRLVAFSWFDVGGESLQSLVGVYDPGHARHSLGFYTMLAEIRFGLETGRRYFYPGYVLPGDPSMDYKLRAGHVEFLDPDLRTWRPWGDFAPDHLPAVRLERSLERARHSLTRRGIAAELRVVPWFDVAARQPALASCLADPLVVECGPDGSGPLRLMVTWDIDRQAYSLVRCLRAEARRVDRDGNLMTPDPTFQLWVVVERLGHRDDPDEIAAAAARVRR